MKNASTAFLVIMLISSLSLWGCSNQKNTAYNNKIRDLEARYGKLEEDYRLVVAASDNHRKKLAQLETQRSELTQQVEELKSLAQERDDLKKQLTQRTTERDTVQTQLVEFSRDLQNLVGRVDAAARNSSPGVSATPASLKND